MKIFDKEGLHIHDIELYEEWGEALVLILDGKRLETINTPRILRKGMVLFQLFYDNGP